MGNWLNKPFLTLAISLFFALYLVLAISAQQFYNLGITPQGASLVAQAVSTETVLRSESFFLNNLQVSSVLFIPIGGLFYFFMGVLNTGQIVGLLAASIKMNPLLYIAEISFPVGIIEFVAYAILAAEISYLTILAIDRSGAKQRLITQTWKSVLLWLALLGLAAVLEAII